VYGLNSERKEILEEMHQKGVIEIRDVDVADTQLERKETAQSISQFDGFINSSANAIEILDQYAPEKTGLFSSRESISMDQYSMKSVDSEGALKKVSEIIRLADKIHENAENIRKIDAKQVALQPFLQLDVPMNITETRDTIVKSGTLHGAWTEKDIHEALRRHEIDELHFELITNVKEYTTIWFVYPKEIAHKANALFQAIALAEPSFSLSHHVPEKKTEVLDAAKKELAEEAGRLEKEIAKYGKDRSDIKLLYDHLVLRKEKYQAIAKMGMTAHTFVMEGYVLDRYAGQVRESLEQNHGAYVEIHDPEDPAKAPVHFQNNGFVAPVSWITSTYSMPGQHDIDPNPIMSFFYYFFFGMMFSDAGYGLLMAVACFVLGYGKVLEPAKRGTFKMFFFCGVSTVFWGFMYGGFFGDATHTISSVFLGGDAMLRPLWMDPTQEPLTLLVFSVMLGIIHLLIGMGIKVYTLVRDRQVLEAVADNLIWMVIMGFIMVLATGMFLSLSGVAVPAAANAIGMYGLLAGLVVLVVIKTVAGMVLGKKNIIASIGGGVLSIYDITGYIGDMLSYSRLLALGLATGVIANVVNMMGSMFGAGVIGTIFFVVVFILGHIVNFALNALGAYVHTMRLQYVEYYSKFYEGGGEPFKPFKMDTKYYRFSNQK
jgi:V/A-type H+-transporting ATPase subunit I